MNLEHLPLVLKLAVPVLAIWGSSQNSFRTAEGRRYRMVVQFRPPLEGTRDAWAGEIRRGWPGADDITITPRNGTTLLGWAYRATRTRRLEPQKTRVRVGNAEGILVRLEELGEVQP